MAIAKFCSVKNKQLYIIDSSAGQITKYELVECLVNLQINQTKYKYFFGEFDFFRQV